MPQLPVFLNVAGRRCLVIGDGGPAEAKVRALLDAGALVRVVAGGDASRELDALAAAEPRLEVRGREYAERDLEGCWLVFLASSDAELRARVSADAERAHLWLNAIDVPESCSFTMPAILRRGRIAVAVGTGGASPLLAARVRDRVDASIGPEFAEAADLLADLRARLAPGADRQRAFAALLDAGLLDALRAGDRARVEGLTRDACAGLPPRAPGDEVLGSR